MTKIIEGAKEAQRTGWKRIYDLLAEEGGGTWATYTMMEIDAVRAAESATSFATAEAEPIGYVPASEMADLIAGGCAWLVKPMSIEGVDADYIPVYTGAAHSYAEVERMREALRRLIDTYKDMQDGDGNPCPDVAFAREVLNGGSDAG